MGFDPEIDLICQLGHTSTSPRRHIPCGLGSCWPYIFSGAISSHSIAARNVGGGFFWHLAPENFSGYGDLWLLFAPHSSLADCSFVSRNSRSRWILPTWKQPSPPFSAYAKLRFAPSWMQIGVGAVGRSLAIFRNRSAVQIDFAIVCQCTLPADEPLHYWDWVSLVCIASAHGHLPFNFYFKYLQQFKLSVQSTNFLIPALTYRDGKKRLS